MINSTILHKWETLVVAVEKLPQHNFIYTFFEFFFQTSNNNNNHISFLFIKFQILRDIRQGLLQLSRDGRTGKLFINLQFFFADSFAVCT